MRVAIMAAGGVGGFLGGRLAHAGVDVAMLARGAHLAAIQHDGLTVATPKETITARPRIATSDPAEIGPVDLVVFAVKLPDFAAAAASLRPLLKDDTGVIPFQNGVEAADLLAAAIGPQHAMMGTCYILAEVASPGHIHTSGPPGRFFFGENDGSQSTRSIAFRELLKSAGVDAPLPADVRTEVWRKFAYLSAMSALTAVTRSNIGTVRGDPDLRRVFERAVEETIAVAKASGIDLPADSVSRYNHFLDVSPPEARSSLAKDLESGRPLEVQWLSGAVERIGRERGVDTPVHSTIHAALKPFATGRR